MIIPVFKLNLHNHEFNIYSIEKPVKEHFGLLLQYLWRF